MTKSSEARGVVEGFHDQFSAAGFLGRPFTVGGLQRDSLTELLRQECWWQRDSITNAEEFHDESSIAVGYERTFWPIWSSGGGRLVGGFYDSSAAGGLQRDSEAKLVLQEEVSIIIP
jgi:hypothetical protein